MFKFNNNRSFIDFWLNEIISIIKIYFRASLKTPIIIAVIRSASGGEAISINMTLAADRHIPMLRDSRWRKEFLEMPF